MTQKLSKLLMLGALALLWLPAVAFGWNTVFKRQWQSRPLAGVEKITVPPALTPSHFMDGSFQRGVAQRLGPSIPFYGDAVRWHNQILYTVLNFSASRHILIGKDNYLLNPFYTSEYCHRDIKKSEYKLEGWARMLREIQDKVEARGQIFLYVLTPSKIEHLPETLPSGFPCPSPDRDRFIAAALLHLNRHGVKYVDATSHMGRIRPTYSYDPFPAGGIHWTNLASYPATLEMIKAINARKGMTVIQPYDIAVQQAKEVAESDQDYVKLLNIVWEPEAARTAEISIGTPLPAECPEPMSILAIGGSFFANLGMNLSAAPCPPNIALLFYFVRETQRYKNGKLISDGKEPDYSLIASSDVIVVEENVGVLMKTQHIPALHKYLHTGKLPERNVL